MSAYATAQLERPPQLAQSCLSRRLHDGSQPKDDGLHDPLSAASVGAALDGGALLDVLVDEIAARVASAVVRKLAAADEAPAREWLDSRTAADYLGVHRDTLRKLAAERAIPAHQDGPGCKLFFRRTDLDSWRHRGGPVLHLASVLDAAA